MKKLKILLDAKKLNFLLKDKNINKSLNKSLSKIVPLTSTLEVSHLKFPLKIKNNVEKTPILSFIYNSKTVYKKQNNISFLGENEKLTKAVNTQNIFSKFLFIANNKKNIHFKLISNNLDKLI
jgi:hypothetical protein